VERRRATLVTSTCRDREVIAAVVKWSEEFIEQPHEIFGGLPVCPFARMAVGELRNFQAFEAHPLSNFRIGSLYTRRSPYPSFQVLGRAILKKSSDSLLDSPYYTHFTPEMFRAVGMPR
jgi:hypothetical protein